MNKQIKNKLLILFVFALIDIFLPAFFIYTIADWYLSDFISISFKHSVGISLIIVFISMFFKKIKNKDENEDEIFENLKMRTLAISVLFFIMTFIAYLVKFLF